METHIPERVAFRKMSFDGRAITAAALGPWVDGLLDELTMLAKLGKLGKLAKKAEKA